MKFFYILLAACFCCCRLPAAAQDLRTAPIQGKEQFQYRALVYKGTFRSRQELFYRSRNFFGEYFDRTTPQILNIDKQQPALTIKVYLPYSFANERGTVNARASSIAELIFEDSAVVLMLSQFELQHRKRRLFDRPRMDLEQTADWKQVNTDRLFEGLVQGQGWARAEVQAVDQSVQKLIRALTAELND